MRPWNGAPTEECYLRQFIDWFREKSDITGLEIGLDAVIFDDGEMKGPDESGLAHHFAAYVEAKQSLYRSLVAGLDAGKSVDEVFRPIEAAIAANAASLGTPASRADHLRDLIRNPLALYPRQAAPEVRGWRLQYGDAELPRILRRAVRGAPFVIRRA